MVRSMHPLTAVDSGTHQLAQMLAKGEPTMRSHWTNPTIVRRPTIAALAAAALLVACDQPAGPSRPGGRILANATGGTGTVSAHGSGTVFGSSCDFSFIGCDAGGKGLKFSFDFSGPNTHEDVVPVQGTWSASDPETGVQAVCTADPPGHADLLQYQHAISVIGLCVITTSDGRSL